MNASRRCILLAMLIAGVFQAAIAKETASPPPAKTDRAEVDRQVRANKTLLLEGKDEQIRLDAARLLLFGDNGESRKELLDVLRDQGHPEARAAICKALTIPRDDGKQVAHKEELIEPLVAVLSTENDPCRAELAAQALLIFAYGDVQAHLERLIADPNGSKAAHANAVKALKYQPDDRAIFRLVELIGAPQVEIAAESRKALELLGIDVPSDPNGVAALTEAMRRRGPEAFLRNPLIMRNWLASRENRIQELTASLAGWEQKYLATLGRLYDVQADEKARSEFLSQQLNSPESSIKLWVLGKLEELRKGTGKGKPSPELEKSLLGLISHRNRRVRLRTASLLTLMWDLDSTSPLLGQLRVEEDAEVRHGLFVALGNACYYASLPTSSVKVPDTVRKQTLELAVTFLRHAEAEKARSGADVIRKLLEQDGLKAAEIETYLIALADRYRQTSPATNHGLRGEFLNAMAVLCAERSVGHVRTQAAKLYGPVFDQALGDELEPVRLAAIEGLINIDNVAAMKRLRGGFPGDSSAAIRAKVTDLAGEVGRPDDLEWLAKKLSSAGEGEAAWQAMVKVFRRSGMEVMDAWLTRFEQGAGPNKLAPGRMISLLTFAEQNAQGQKQAKRLGEIRIKLLSLYAESNNTARATEYMTLVLAAVANDPGRDAVVAGLLDICLKAPGAGGNLAGTLIERYLAERDLGADNPVAKSLNGYLQQPPAGADPNALITRLRQITVKEPDARPQWGKMLLAWEAFAKAQKPAVVEKANN